MTLNPAAGPLTCSGLPAISPTTNPPTIPVMIPTLAALLSGTPEAIAMPMHSGNATRNTTIEAKKSFERLANAPGAAGGASECS